MIERIHIRDFAVARDVVIEPDPGLNAFTGETGAGKSLVVDALAFACGARRGREVVASGADRATVALTLAIPGRGRNVIERSVSLSGRSTARLNGEPAQLAAIEALAADLVDIHGQSGQLAILRPHVQLRALDEFAGLDGQRAALATAVRQLREVRRRLESLRTGVRERERLASQLAFEVNEIDAAALTPGEGESLRAEQRRLANAGRLIADADRALEALASASLGEATSAVAALAAGDDSAADIQDLGLLLDATAADLSRALRHYREMLDADPGALARVEERLDQIARLRRKYGDTVADILAYAGTARQRLADLTGAEQSAEELAAREAELTGAVAGLGMALSYARREAAARLAGALGVELSGLGMGTASLAVGFEVADDPTGAPAALPDYELMAAGAVPGALDSVAEPRAFGESGFDRLEFLASFNPGETPRPLGAVASGGETSRFLLALATVLAAGGPRRLIVFDEVDEGVGGRAGGVVGAALARLAGPHQVFCVTHLPQVAAFASRHFVVEKTASGGRTWTTLRTVEGEDRFAELASMLGGDTPPNRAAARELSAVAKSDLMRERFGDVTLDP